MCEQFLFKNIQNRKMQALNNKEIHDIDITIKAIKQVKPMIIVIDHINSNLIQLEMSLKRYAISAF